jgi:hypothetical protein
MGFLDVFGKKSVPPKKEDVVIGYLRMETSKHLGLPVNSAKYDAACESAAQPIEQLMLPNLNRDAQQELFNTIAAACPSRAQEAYGQCLVLLWVRFGVIQHAIAAGKVKAEEATLDILVDALHRQIRRMSA